MGARVHPKSNCLSAPVIEDYPQEKHVVWDAVKSSCSPERGIHNFMPLTQTTKKNGKENVSLHLLISPYLPS